MHGKYIDKTQRLTTRLAREDGAIIAPLIVTMMTRNIAYFFIINNYSFVIKSQIET